MRKSIFLTVFVLVLTVTSPARANIFQATLMEANQPTAEISTDEMRLILSNGSAVVFDARPFMEFAVSHIPGAVNVAPKPDVPMSQYVSDVAEIGRLLNGDKGAAIVLYCNGPFCGKSKRLSAELLAAGYTNVRRYQLGIPVWRALVGLTQIEPAGIESVYRRDKTALFVDARPAAVASKSIRKAVNIPLAEVTRAKDDGRLPMEDHNTRIVVFGTNAAEARAVANEIAKNAFHNVAFFAGTFEEMEALLDRNPHDLSDLAPQVP
jgi:rhodanese-related sulfurtransferase